MNEFSDDELNTALKNAEASGRKSDASFIAEEINRRTKSASPQGSLDYSSLGPATTVPGPQGFMEDTGLNAFGRGIRENIGGGIGAAAGASGGAELGGGIGTFIGGPGLGTAVGSGIGGIGGGILGALFGGKAQQMAFPTSEETARILAADEQNHPNMSWAGAQVPFLATTKASFPGIKSALTKVTPEMTAAEVAAIRGSQVGMAMGGGLGMASEVAMPLINDQEIDPMKVLASGILGTLFNEPNRLGRGLGMPSTPNLADVRAQQMAAAAQPPPTSTAVVPYQEAPLIDTHLVRPGEVGMPETGAYPVGNTDVRFRETPMLNGPDQMMALPARAEAQMPQQPMLPESAMSGADSIMPRMREEQAAGMQAQLDRLKERHAALVSRGADKPALRALDTQIKARSNALRGLQNESTIIAPEPVVAPRQIIETPTPLPHEIPTPVTEPQLQPLPVESLPSGSGIRALDVPVTPDGPVAGLARGAGDDLVVTPDAPHIDPLASPAKDVASLPPVTEDTPIAAPKGMPEDGLPNTGEAPVARVADTPEVASLRKQLEQIDDDILMANEDGDSYGAEGLRMARRNVQDQIDEMVQPTMKKSIGEKLRSKKVKLKGDTFNMPILGLSGDDARRLWNGALEIAAKLADTGTNIKAAAKQASAWARQNFPTARFKDDDFHSALEADVVEGLPSARKAAAKEESFKAAEQMDNNPDKFFTDAGETPVSTYMDGISQTMKDAKNDMMSGRTVKKVIQHMKDFNRNWMRGNQAALNDLAEGKGGTGRKSPALKAMNERLNGTRPGAEGTGKRGQYDDTIQRTKSRTNELNAAYNGIRETSDTLKGHEKEAFFANIVKWMQSDNSPTHLRNQPALLKAIDTIRKVSRDMIEDLKKVGIDIGDSGIKYFTRMLDADVVKRNYDEFVAGMAKIYDQQWKQSDPKYVTDMARATSAAKAYADATILGHDDIHLDGSDLLLSGKQRTGDADFFKARTFTGAAGDNLDATMAKFYKRNPFETINMQINRTERRIGLAKAFGKTTWDADAGKYVLDPVAKWKDFVNAAVKEGNEKIIPEVLERYQTMYGLGGNFNPTTNAFNQFTRTMGYYAYLPFSGINSIVEPTVMAMRLNKPVSGLFQSYGKSFRSISRQLLNKPLDYKERLADAMGIAENATMRAAMSLGKMDEQGLMTGKGLARYMFLTGNSVVGNATSNAAVDIGMSALRVALLDHAHGEGGNTPRIWLEELGVKKADFDRVSKWLEGHATDEDRFGAVMDGSKDANIVRDALSKFAREARSMPDAGTKSKTFSNPAGQMLLSLQSFLYDFADKVLGRNARQFMQGVKGEVHFDGDIDATKLSPQDRMHLMAPMALGMPALLAANYGVAMVREALYPDPEKIRRDRERTAGEINWNRFTRALSRTNALGPYDMLFNMFTQARYERDVAAMAVGPYFGGVLELAKNVAALSGERNSGNTNTAERKAVRSAWNIGPKPLINMALASLPATKALTPIAAAGIQLSSQRATGEGAVDLIAGRAQDTRNRKK